MGMTITEKILAHAAGDGTAGAGDIVTVCPDWIMTNDATTHLSIDIFNNAVRSPRVHRADRTIFVIDHNVPSESVKTAQVQNKMRSFARRHGLILHDGEGICHQLLLEKYVCPGQIVIGADSHTCSMGALGALGCGVGSTDFVAAMVTGRIWLRVPETIALRLHGALPPAVYARDLMLRILGDIRSDGATYMALEFGGPAVRDLTIHDRIVLCNLAVEAGAKNGIVAADERTQEYLSRRGPTAGRQRVCTSDPDAIYKEIRDYDLGSLEPAVACPHHVDNYDTVAHQQREDVSVHQGFIGSCSGGRIDDLRVAARILAGTRVKPAVKLLVSPASRDVYLQALREGLVEVFLAAGAMVVNPNCSVCWGASQGVLGDDEVLISTGTRNFKGRSGSPRSLVYLASAATVAASCIRGRITDPREYL